MVAQANPSAAYSVGVDIGGTFTDLCLARDGRVVHVGKGLTTPEAPAIAVERVLVDALDDAGLGASAVGQVVHGTTLVTNALLERRGARTAMLTTAGFRDVVEMGRERRSDLYDLMVEIPRPLVARHLRFDVPERTLADGRVEEPVDEGLVEELARELASRGVEALAVCFLNSFANASNERQAAEAARRAAPELALALSSEVAPEIREYERWTTTTATAYVQQLVRDYIADLEARLTRVGVSAELRIMLSNGGIATAETASRFPIRMLESGPAAGAIAAATFGAEAGRRELLSFDMGGTTAKVCAIENGRPTVSHDFEVDRVYRLRRGSGLPIKTPVVDMVEIGVGGGSIARVDSLGLLVVGPQSAGAEPGPACYGRGGRLPTVTDADLVLGYLDADAFLGGSMRLDAEAARAAIERDVAAPLGIPVEQAAWGIHDLVNADMASAARVHIVERGQDPTGLVLFAFGGAGPVHACGVARALGVRHVVVPTAAGVMSAVGLLAAPISIEHARSRRCRLLPGELDGALRLLDEMEAEGERVLRGSGIGAAAVVHERAADMRYVGQGFEIEVGVPAVDEVDRLPTVLARAFAATYERVRGRTGPAVDAEALTWRVVSRGPAPELSLDDLPARGGAARAASARQRPVWSPSAGGTVTVDVFERGELAPEHRLSGPAVIQERESTLVLPDDAVCRVAGDGTLAVDLGTAR